MPNLMKSKVDENRNVNYCLVSNELNNSFNLSHANQKYLYIYLLLRLMALSGVGPACLTRTTGCNSCCFGKTSLPLFSVRIQCNRLWLGERTWFGVVVSGVITWVLIGCYADTDAYCYSNAVSNDDSCDWKYEWGAAKLTSYSVIRHFPFLSGNCLHKQTRLVS